MKRAYWASLGVVCIVGGLIALGACSNQGEGERCDVLNGDDDCVTGLTCFRAVDLTNTVSDRCCPADRSLASNPVCKTPLSAVGNDAQAPADTGPPSDANLPVDTGAPSSDADGAVDAGSDG